MALMIDRCPIDRLPTETLSNVFLLAIRPIRPRLYRTTSVLAKLTAIAAVSKRWRSIVDGAPELWSFLHSADPIEITRMALEKSKDTSLTITCIQYQYPKADKSRVATRFIDCVTPQIERWRFVFFRATSAILRRIPSAAAPRLRSVTFHCKDSHFMLDNPFSGQASQLRELVCMRTGFRWSSGLLAGLSSLRIILGQNEQVFIRCTELYAALASSPNLQALVIIQPTLRTDEPDVLEGVPTLHFPYLTEIKLCAPFAFTNTILAHIEAPSCSTFRAEADVESTELLDRLVPYLPKFINNQPLESWRAELYVEEERMGFTLSPGHKAFTVWQPFDLELYGDWLSTFSWIIDKLLPSTTTRFPMSIHFSEGCEFFEYLLESVLLRLPCVQQLTLEHTENPEVVWGWLAEPTQHNGTSQWLFPELRKLETYNGGYDWDVLVVMVRNRWGPGDDRELDPPESLERLRLIGSDLTEEQMESLKEVIGDENVTLEYSDGETDSAESDWKADLLL